VSVAALPRQAVCSAGSVDIRQPVPYQFGVSLTASTVPKWVVLCCVAAPGMDPISRRAVWDVIQEAKQGRAVVLTTHR
jgi:hypothetical protein